MSDHTPPGTEVGARREEVLDQVVLRRRAGELSLEEHARAVHRVAAAATVAELDAAAAAVPRGPAVTPAPRRWVVSILGGTEQRGRWSAAGALNIVAVLGGAELDLGRACIAGDTMRITCISLLGGVSLRVPTGAPVEFSGFSLLGGRADERRQADAVPGAPVVHVRAVTVLGGVSVDDRRGHAVGLDARPDMLMIRLRRSQARALGTDELAVPYAAVRAVRTGAAGPAPRRRSGVRQGGRLALFRDADSAITIALEPTPLAGEPVSEIAVEVDDPEYWCADLRHRALDPAGNPRGGSAPAPV